LTWHDAADARMKLKVPTTQRHHHEQVGHACWLTISQVRFLCRLSTYYFFWIFKNL